MSAARSATVSAASFVYASGTVDVTGASDFNLTGQRLHVGGALIDGTNSLTTPWISILGNLSAFPATVTAASVSVEASWVLNGSYTINGDVTITGAGGAITFKPFRVGHGSIDALGFRIKSLAYTPDVAEVYDDAWDVLRNLDIWVVDALRRDPHPTHAHLGRTLDWIKQASPKQAILTNMHIDLDYAEVAEETPDHIQPAFDGMRLTLPD